jgi:hypothetical protein
VAKHNHGDLIFSFMDTRILAVGIVQSYAWESPNHATIESTNVAAQNFRWSSAPYSGGRFGENDAISVVRVRPPSPQCRTIGIGQICDLVCDASAASPFTR